MFRNVNILRNVRFYTPHNASRQVTSVAVKKGNAVGGAFAFRPRCTHRNYTHNAGPGERGLEIPGFYEFLRYIAAPMLLGVSLFWLSKSYIRPERKDILRMVEVANEYTRRGMDTRAAKQCQKIYSLLKTESDTSFAFSMMLAMAQHHILAQQYSLAIDAFESASKLVAIMERDHSPSLLQKRNIFRTHAVALLEKADLYESMQQYDKVLPAYYGSIASFLKQKSIRKLADILTETSQKFLEYGHYDFPKELQQLSLEEEQFIMEYCAAYLKKIDFLTNAAHLPETAIHKAMSTLKAQYNTELSMDCNTVFHILAGLKLVYIFQGQRFVEKYSQLEVPTEVYRVSVANPIKVSDPLFSFSVMGPALSQKGKNGSHMQQHFRRDVLSKLTPDVGPLSREILKIRQRDRRKEVISTAERFLDVFSQIELMLVELEAEIQVETHRTEQEEASGEMS